MYTNGSNISLMTSQWHVETKLFEHARLTCLPGKLKRVLDLVMPGKKRHTNRKVTSKRKRHQHIQLGLAKRRLPRITNPHEKGVSDDQKQVGESVSEGEIQNDTLSIDREDEDLLKE